MIKKKCDICSKEVEGYQDHHASYLMKQHKLTHNNINEKGGLENGNISEKKEDKES